MRARLALLFAAVVPLAACAAPGHAASASLVDDVLHAEIQVAESFAQRIEAQQVELRVGDPATDGVGVSTSKAGAKVKVGGIEVGNGKVVVPGVATIGGL